MRVCCKHEPKALCLQSWRRPPWFSEHNRRLKRGPCLHELRSAPTASCSGSIAATWILKNLNMPFFFLNHSHLHITAFIHKKNRLKKGPSRTPDGVTQTRRSSWCCADEPFLYTSRPFRGFGKRYCFNGLISCVRVDSQWEISALGGAAITWPPPFIKYLPAHSQRCSLFRIAPMITFPAFAVQCATLTPVFVSISLLFQIIYPCSVLATPPPHTHTTPVKNIFVTEEVTCPFSPTNVVIETQHYGEVVPPRCACF